MCDDCNRMFHVFLVTIDALRLVNRVKSALQLCIVRGDPRRAGILIALESLDAPSANMKPRADTQKSAPMQSAQATSAGVTVCR